MIMAIKKAVKKVVTKVVRKKEEAPVVLTKKQRMAQQGPK